MELADIYNIGRALGVCKIWTISESGSIFYAPMPSPLIDLKELYKKVGIQSETIDQAEEIITILFEAINSKNKNKIKVVSDKLKKNLLNLSFETS